jgi:DNA invertase Pin-like site-specific DNA recombinase
LAHDIAAAMYPHCCLAPSLPVASHTEREQLQKLLRNAEQREFDRVLVDDLSRLSRDLGATWRIVFEDLASRGVRVIDCTTGVASYAVGAD